MKTLKFLPGVALIAGAALNPAMAQEAVSSSQMSANAALTTNYVWRGSTLSDDGPAVQGGFDWSNKDGWYAGVWGSTIDTPTADLEIDLYAGYTFQNYDAGIIIYTNEDDFLGDADIIELKLAGDFDVQGVPVGAELYISLDTPTLVGDYQYLTVNAGFDVEGIAVKPYLGTYFGDLDGMHFGVVGSKVMDQFHGVELSVGLDISDDDIVGPGADDTFLYVMAAKTFDL